MGRIFGIISGASGERTTPGDVEQNVTSSLIPLPRGRGASWNPQNRFERLHLEPALADLEEAGELDQPAPATVYYRDKTQSVIAYNDSPDVGFDAGINPYRGCSHGCSYCHSPETPILMANGTTRAVALLNPGEEIYGTVRRGDYRRYVRTVVLAQWETRKPAYRVTLADGTELIASGDHRFLSDRGWKFVTGTEWGADRRPHLTVNNKLMGVGALHALDVETTEYRRG